MITPVGCLCSTAGITARLLSTLSLFHCVLVRAGLYRSPKTRNTNTIHLSHTPLDSIGGCSSPSPRPWAHRWRINNVRDTWPVRRQTYSYLPSHKASPPIGWTQTILLSDRGTCVLTTCPGLHSTAEWPGFKPATCWSQVQHYNHSATKHYYIKL